MSVPISQNKLAEHAGIDRKTISDAERGKSKPQDVTLVKIANALSELKGVAVGPEQIED
jgi:DNA-binding XRE family transcriptional regulator